MNRIDNFKHKGLRQQMVDAMRAKGITDESVLKAMAEVPRHWFLDGALDAYAYEDRALKIMSEHDVRFTVDMKMGKCEATAWGCDLTYDYVKINGDYRS